MSARLSARPALPSRPRQLDPHLVMATRHRCLWGGGMGLVLLLATLMTACCGPVGASTGFDLPTPSSEATLAPTQEAETAATAASRDWPTPTSAATVVRTTAPIPTATRTRVPPTAPPPTETATPAQAPGLYVPPELPSPIFHTLHASLALSSGGDGLAPSAEAADVRLVLDPGPGDAIVGEAVYAVVAPFPTLIDEVAWADVRATWDGVASGPFALAPLLVGPNTAAALAARMGDPSPGSVEIVPADELLQRTWDSRPSWAIVPFDVLEPRWKVLRVDGHSVLDRQMDLATYPLAVSIGLRGPSADVGEILQLIGSPITNWDRENMSVIVMTGVTALARGTGMRIDWYGPEYLVEDIAQWLMEPDITHISTEVSFAEDCPPPADYTTTVFCSNPRYIELLEILDIDIIELTGNHLLDWGVEAMEHSLSMYDERGLPYFGGGWDLSQAQTPVTMTDGVHTFAFVGCNPAGPRSDWATADLPGSAPCDYDLLYGQIRALREGGLVPIVTLQYREAYQYEPLPQQRIDFGALAEAGAVIVSGSQAHQPQGFAFEHSAFIHYGLGNLFFDQMWSLETRQEFVDRHVFYDGRHISTELLTAILEDYARPRPMTPAERIGLLRAAFAASGW